MAYCCGAHDIRGAGPAHTAIHPRRTSHGELLVGDLAEALGLTQPLTSKHLRVLRDAGFVTVRVDGPRRWYCLRVEPLAELDDWLAPYRWMWESRLDQLGEHLDAMPDHEGDSDVR